MRMYQGSRRCCTNRSSRWWGSSLHLPQCTVALRSPAPLVRLPGNTQSPQLLQLLPSGHLLNAADSHRSMLCLLELPCRLRRSWHTRAHAYFSAQTCNVRNFWYVAATACRFVVVHPFQGCARRGETDRAARVARALCRHQPAARRCGCLLFHQSPLHRRAALGCPICARSSHLSLGGKLRVIPVLVP